MEIEILPNSCRVCLKENNKLKSLYTTNDDEEPPCVMLRKLTGINLEDENDEKKLPKQICRNCICELHLAYQFLEKVLKTQIYIDKFCNQEATVNNTNEGNISDNVIIKEERLDLRSNSDSNDSLQNPIEYCEEDLRSSYKSENRENISKKKYCTLNEKSKKINATNNILSTRGRKPKLTDEENKSYICDICGNIFSKRCRLTEHRRRHDTEANFACELCDERFVLREMLRRHMYQHIPGGKPFKCSYCSRTFFYESVKKVHECIHTGLKPYECDSCNKTFAYPHALKKHKLIHDDIKLYHCTYCNKDFRLQHHLKQHIESKLHQNAEQTSKTAKKINTK